MSRSLILFSLVLGGACKTEPTKASDLTPGFGLERFESCDEVRDYVAEAWLDSILSGWYGWGWGYAEEGAAEDDASGDGDGGGSGPTDYSETNVQEQGVDEPDVVKTDGEYVYYLQDQTLTVTDSWPVEDAALTATLDFAGWPYSMFLLGDTLAVFSWEYNDEYDYGKDVPDDGEDVDPERDTGDEAGSEEPVARVGDFKSYSYTRVSIVDLGDRTNPQIVREIDLDGYFVDARLIDSDLYVVTDTWLEMPWEFYEILWSDSLGLPELDWDASEEEVEAARDEARTILEPIVTALVSTMSDEELLPLVRDHLPDEDASARMLLGCTEVYRPEHASYPSTLSLVHVDLDDATTVGSEVAATGLMSDGWTVYASQDHLYIAQPSYYWYWGWGDFEDTTQIHRFALEGADSIYEGSGEVDGWLFDQFAMSEYDGYLRVATSDQSWGWGAAEVDEAVSEDSTEAEEGTSSESEDARVVDLKAEEDAPANNVFVLEFDGEGMEVVGELGGIAPDETIYAVRFLEDKGYVVTFQQTDPLFTIDLSDPTAPTLVGELEVPGFSTYLHPVDNGMLLAIGMDGTEDGSITGLAVSLFDVSDFANPTLAAKYVMETDDWSYSEALYDHHAFTYHRGVLSLPAYAYDYDDATGEWDEFSGILVIEVDTGAESGTPALTELGRVDHADLVAESDCYYDDWYDEGGEYEDPCDWYWYAWMRRSVVIEDNLFSISNYGIKVNELTNPEVELARVLFNPAE